MRLSSGAVLGIYAALAVLFFWPLAIALPHVLPHDLGDPVGYTWILWWNAHARPLTDAWLNAPIFHPSPGAMALQDAFLGVWPISTPLIRAGLTPVTVHNGLVIASFAFAAFTAYLLCLRLTSHRLAAFAGGLVYGFSIFRVSQLAHLHILLTFWIPLIFLGLHRYLETRRFRWLLVAAACWAIQAITSGYFLVFSTIMIGLWALFFFRTRVTDYARLAGALGLGLLAIWPILSAHRSVHEAYGFRRGLAEAEHYSADVISFFRAPPVLSVWGPLLGYDTGEDQLFPGLILAVVVLGAAVTSRYARGRWWSKWTLPLMAVAALCGVAAVAAAVWPGSYGLGPLSVSLNRPYKPLSWVCLSLLAAFLTSAPVREVIRSRSLPGFYLIAAVMLWLLALGPTVRVAGVRIWYKAPYSWLSLIPGADAVRVPTRLWTLVTLALAAVTAVGLERLARRRPRFALPSFLIVCTALLAEAWPGRLPLPSPPHRLEALERDAGSSIPVLELPLETPGADYAAMYRATFHRRPVVNGASGYSPPSFDFLGEGLRQRDGAVLLPFTELGPLDIVVHHEAPAATGLIELVQTAGGVQTDTGSGYAIFRLPPRPATTEPDEPPALEIAQVHAATRGDVTALLTDDDPWTAVEPEPLEITLRGKCQVTEVRLATRAGLDRVEVSVPGVETPLWTGPVSELGVRAAMRKLKEPLLRIPLPVTSTDRLMIRPRVAANAPSVYISKVAVAGACASG